MAEPDSVIVTYPSDRELIYPFSFRCGYGCGSK